MLNKKGIEEQGTVFPKDNITKIIIFLIVLSIAILIIIPILSAEKEGSTLLNFGKYVLDILTGGT